MSCHVAVFLSGAAGLMYQVAWTRKLIGVTSATVLAQALVIAVFMAGLGIGSALAARAAGRAVRPARSYALVEGAAALAAVVSFPFIEGSAGIRTFFFTLGFSLKEGLTAQLLIVCAFLLVPTTLLGASLPLMIAHCERRGDDFSAARRGRIVSALYGINTAGAVLGSYLAGFMAIEHLGLARTGFAGATLAAAAVLIVLASPARRLPAVSREHARRHAVEKTLLLAAALSGFVGLGAEVLWIRLYALIIPNTVYAFSQVLMAVLVGIALGAWLAGFIANRAEPSDPNPQWAGRTAGLLACLAAVVLGTIPLLVVRLADDLAFQKSLASGSSLASAIVLLFGLLPASALVASVLPLLTVASKVEQGSRSFGLLYGANTAGGVLGSLTMGLVLVPFLGLRGAGASMVAVCLLAAFLLLYWSGAGRREILAGCAAAATSVLLHFSHDVPLQIYRNRLAPQEAVREFYEGASSHVMVTDSMDTGLRRLWINSFWVAGTGGPHRAFGHLPALFVDRPERALGIALGTGQTFAAVMKHGTAVLDSVEIDRGVIELSRRWFSEFNDSLFENPRVRVFHDDGRAFLRVAGTQYDVIVLEPLQAWSAGTANLYSKEFYEDARRALTEGGVVSQWIPFYGQGVDETRSMVRTGLEVFEHGSMWLSGKDGILLLSREPFKLSRAILQERLDERGLRDDLLRLPAADIDDLFAFFLLGSRGLRSWTEGAETVRDDRPFIEFRAAGQIGATGGAYREIVRSVMPHLDRLEHYLPDGAKGPSRPMLLAEQLRRTILEVSLLPAGDLEGQAEKFENLPPEVRSLLPWEHYYRQVVRQWLSSDEVRLSGRERAEEILERAERNLGFPARNRRGVPPPPPAQIIH